MIAAPRRGEQSLPYTHIGLLSELEDALLAQLAFLYPGWSDHSASVLLTFNTLTYF